nr:Na+ dependent nucleoside transporter N-terminal domain-containing protein [Aquirufa antheringensis]
MERFTGLLGIVLILGVSFLMSNNRKAINYRTVGVGLLMQVLLAVFILKTETGQNLFQWLGDSINTLLGQADKGAQFVFGSLVNRDLMIKAFGPGNDYIFFFKVVPTIIFVSVLVNMFYHLGILQRVVSFIGKGVHWLMGVEWGRGAFECGIHFRRPGRGSNHDQALFEKHDEFGADGFDDGFICLHRRWCNGRLYLLGSSSSVFISR